jgi:asparagine synthase (glutamine-hydrolysing)
MCGIAGIVRLDGPILPQDEAMVSGMLAAQRHRGPDAHGCHRDGPVLLGHRRLAIIDLSPAGRQPMTNEDGTVWVAYNGEIYNYRELRLQLAAAGHVFHSCSDTEVILHGYEQWGVEEMLQRLRGMFAIALYDQRLRVRGAGDPYFFLARDRLGIKPLYYTQREGRLAFASETRALVRCGAARNEIDREALAGFLALGSVPSPRTWLRDVLCVPSGSFLALTPGGSIHIRQYWDLRCSNATPGDEDLPQLLEQTVESHLLSDVPLGVFLSGGMDSAAVAGLASRLRDGDLVTLTVGFPEKEFSEAEIARRFAGMLRTRHHEVLVTVQDFVDELPKLFAAMDQPTADGVNTYFVSRAARQTGLTVVLSGLGGDEVFFGYPHYRWLLSRGSALRSWVRMPAAARRVVAAGAALFGRWQGQERFERFDFVRGREVSQELYLLVRGFFAPSQIARLLGETPQWVQERTDEAFTSLPLSFNGRFDPNHLHYYEMKRYLHDQLLRDSDVFSMAHSLELRVPLLDHKVVERLYRIPPFEKVSRRVNKPKLLEAARLVEVEDASRRGKQGFTFPFSRWMRSQADLLEEQALCGSVLDKAAVRACWREFRRGRLHWSRAWSTSVVGALTARN